MLIIIILYIWGIFFCLLIHLNTFYKSSLILYILLSYFFHIKLLKIYFKVMNIPLHYHFNGFIT